MDDLFPRLANPDDQMAFTVATQGSWTYRELASAAANHARRLDEAGVRSGDRVGVWAETRLELGAAILGNAAAGVVSVPLNAKLGPRELAHIAGDAGLRHVFAASDVGGVLGGLGIVVHDLADSAPGPGEPGSIAFLGGAEPMFVLYTSGTTGPPKGAMITGQNVAANLDSLAATWDWQAEDTVVHALPMFHVHGLILGLLGSLRVGGALHHCGRFSEDGVAAGLARYTSTVLFSVPTMVRRLADAAERDPEVAEALASARLLVSGSAGLRVREHRRVEALTGRGVHERYGLTETLINCSVPAAGPARPGYVGPPLPGVELTLVDEARLPIDARDDATIGEVAVRGPGVFAGYLNRPDATAAVLEDDGWFYTGDLATRTADGAIRIVGRRSTDMIKTGGYKVGAGEIEACLLEHEAVSEVAVVGIEDDDLGQRIAAFVVVYDGAPRPDGSELTSWVAELLTPHKRPREVRFVRALPRNAMGKVQKKALVTRDG